MLYTNLDGINKHKGGELSVLLNRMNPHVVFVTETKMNDDEVTTQFMDCSNYAEFRKDRNSGHGGGVLILVRNDQMVHEYNDKVLGDIEAVACKMKFNHHAFTLVCMYRPPRADKHYNEKINDALHHFGNCGDEQVIICGDFNFPQINWNLNTVQGGETTDQHKFLDATQDAFLHQHVHHFTRVRGDDQPSLLDLVFTREPLEVENMKFKSPIGTSDHCLLTFTMLMEGFQQQQEVGSRRNFFKGNYIEAGKMFEAINWDNELSEKTVQAAWDAFKDHYNCVVESCVPLHKSGLGNSVRKKKWMTKKVMSGIQRKEMAWKRYRKTKSASCLKAYRIIRNKATRTVREAKPNLKMISLRR